MNLHPRILLATDRMLAAVVVALVLGSAVCFGGAVWWFRPAFAVLGFLLAGIKLAQLLIQGRMPILKSPLIAAGPAGARARASCSLCPCHRRSLAGSRPSRSRSTLMESSPGWRRPTFPRSGWASRLRSRSPATLDRAATLRWLVGAAVCLGIFWGVSHFADRLGRLYLVWGSIVAAFLLNAALGLVQITGRSRRVVRLSSAGAGPALGAVAGQSAGNTVAQWSCAR